MARFSGVLCVGVTPPRGHGLRAAGPSTQAASPRWTLHLSLRSIVEPHVRALVADHLAVDVSALADAVSIRNDLAADSLDLIELSSLLELRFGVVLSDRMVDGIRSYGDLVDVLVRLIAARNDLDERQDAARESPQARTRLVEADASSSRHWAGALTRYMSQTLVQSARERGPGGRLEILLGPETTAATLGDIRDRFARIGEGLDVTVARAPGSGFLWTERPQMGARR